MPKTKSKRRQTTTVRRSTRSSTVASSAAAGSTPRPPPRQASNTTNVQPAPAAESLTDLLELIRTQVRAELQAQQTTNAPSGANTDPPGCVIHVID